MEDMFDPATIGTPETDFDEKSIVVPPTPKLGEVIKSAGPTAAGMLQKSIGGGIRAIGDMFDSDTISEAGAGIAESGQINVIENRPPGMTTEQEFVQSGVANTLAMAPVLMAGPVGGASAVLAGAGVMAFGPTYHESREAKLGVGRSALHGAIDSALEVAGEFLPARIIFSKTGAPILSRLLKATIADYGGEIATTIFQDLNAKASYNPDMSLRDLVNDVIMTAGSQLIAAPLTAGLGVTMAGTVNGMRKMQERAGFTSPPAAQPQPAQPSVADFESAGIPGQNPPVVAPPTLTATPTAEPIIEPDLMKSRWVQEHADAAGYRDLGQKIMQMDPATRPVVFDAEQNAVNVPLGETTVSPGDVIVTGPLWEGHPEQYMKLLQQEAIMFNREVMGNKVAIVLATGLPENAAGVAVTGFATDGTPIAYINPRHLYDSMLQRKELGKTSYHAEAEAQYSLYHEFGHVIRQFALQDSAAPQQAALEKEFSVAAQDILDGNLKATDFILKYSSPWKIAKGFALNEYGGEKGEWNARSAERFVQYLVDNKKNPNPDLDVSNVTARTFLELLAKRTGGKSWTDVFNFDEFIAEQHARWMRSTKRAQTGPLGQFFTDMNSLMQRYFNWLVRSKRVGKPSDLGPTEAYKKFINAMVTANKVLTEGQVVTPEILKKAGKNPKKVYYDLNPEGDETHKPEYASLTDEDMQYPKVVTLAGKWLNQYGPTKTPFFTMWAGNWELAKAVNLLYYAGTVGKNVRDHLVDTARRSIRDMQVRLERARLEVEPLVIADRLIPRLDQLIEETYGALDGRPPTVNLIRDVTGNPLRLYHGSSRIWDEPRFNRQFADTGVGGPDTKHVWFATDNEYMANSYANTDGYSATGHVMPLWLRGTKILQVPTVEVSQYDSDAYLEAISTARAINADVIHFEHVMDYGFSNSWSPGTEGKTGGGLYMFFHGEQVKSALGNKTFAPNTSNLLWDRSSAAAMGEEEPLRRMTVADPQIDITPYLEAGRVIRKKWWLLEQLRRVGVDLSSFEVNLQQWQHIAQRLNGLPFVQRFVDLSRMFTEEKNLNVKYPSEVVVKGAKQLGKTQLNQLRKLLEWETDLGEHRTKVFDGFHPEDGRPMKVRQIEDRAKFADDAQKVLGFRPDALVLDYFDDIRTGMHNQLEALYMAAAEKAGVVSGLVNNMTGEFGDLLVDAKSEDLVKLQALLDKPQYPYSRFGKYAIIIERETGEVKDGVPQMEPVHYRHFEFEKDRDDAFARLRLDPGQKKKVFNYFNDYVGFSVIPQSFVDIVIQRAGFDPNSAQADELRALAAVQRNTNLFKRFEEDFRLTDRTEHDILKDFADFSGHLAALTAKVKYRRHLSLAVAEAGKAKDLLDSQGVNSSDMQLLHHYMQQQLQYGMTPQDELQGLRSFITKALLFGNVRAAAVNTTSILNTAAFLDGLVSKYNVLSWPSLLPMVKSAIQSIGGTNTVTKRLSPDEMRLIQDAEARGITDQSYSYHLAAAAESGIMYRLNRSNSKWGTRIIESGMLPFRAIERYTRRVGLLTAYRVAKAHPEILNGKTPEQFAKEALYLTQADYTAFNRPRSQQGLKAAALIFFTYTQNMVALFGGTLGGATAARMFLIYTMLGGLMGLPFAEDLMNLSNWVWRRIFKGDNDLRVAAREVANTIPYLGPTVLRGVMHNIGGFDLSHSVSMGRVIPGLDSFAQSNMKSVDESFGSFAFDLMGPLGGYARGWLQAGAAMLNEPGAQSAIRMAQAAVPSQRSLMDLALFAAQSGSPGKVQGYAGQIITKEEDGSVRELSATELLGKALGFNPEIVSRNREIDFLQREIATFWTQRRKHFMDLHWQAVQLRDPEMRADVRDAIRQFNSSVPDKHLKITSEDIQRSIKQRERIKSLEQRGKSPVKRYTTLYSDVEAAFGG